MRRVTCIAVAVLLLGVGAASSQVLKVPLTYPTIAAALQAAGSGQTVLVEGGTYRENITWPSVDGIKLIGIYDAVIDGGANGSVITVGAGLTRATVIQGFLIRNGLAKDGAGLHLQSSITVRDNTISACEGRDSTLNRGGGIFIASGASPLIEGNAIDANVLRNGATNQGAGIYVGAPSQAVIRGNRIRSNSSQGPGSSYGAGIYFAPSGIPSPLLANNVIALNQNQGTNAASGGGVYVDGGTVQVFNNTIADNGCSSTTRATGGGLGFGNTNGAASPMRNNIVVRNQCAAAVQIGGGIHCNNANISSDFNNVWQNGPDDYFGCTPGPNDLSVDPLFATGTYRLSQFTSPMVDAGDDSVVGTRSAVDVDGDSRQIDGDRNRSARVDMGADEFTRVSLRMSGGLGQGLVIDVQSINTFPYGASLGVSRANVLVPPFGRLLIANPTLVGGGTTPSTLRLPLPLLPALEGLEIFAQALVYNNSPLFGEFTERASLVLTTPFARPIVETFRSRRQFDSGDALWGVVNGLAAGYGFGGTGTDGNLDVTGTVTLDGDVRGAGTYAEWDFQNLTVRPGATLIFTGGRPVRIRVAGNAVIDGDIDVSGRNGGNAGPGKALAVGIIPGGRGGPGAGDGGFSNPNANNPVGALPTDLRGFPGYPKANTCNDLNKSENRLITIVEPNCGGGMGGNRGRPSGLTLRQGCSGNGGGHGGDGDQTDFLCGIISSFGRDFGKRWVVAAGPSEVTAPTSGTGGGGGGNTAISPTNPVPRDDIVAGSGGGGGGGLEITALGTITVRGRILSNGGNGGFGHTTVVNNVTISGGFGGGGSGGSVWLSGASVAIDSAATVSAVGGIGNPSPANPPRTGNGGPGYIILRDLAGNPTIGANATITPPFESTRTQLTTSGNTSATSKWYRATVAQPAWAFNASNPQTGNVIPGSDLIFTTQPGTGQQVKISFQGAPDLNGQPNPNPATWVPPGGPGTTTNIAQVANLRHIRFKIEFSLGPIQGPPLPTAPVIDRVTLRY